MDIACQCGVVSFKTGIPAPLAVYYCHCTECRKQSSSAFGISVTFPIDALPLSDPVMLAKLKVWTRPTRTGYTVDCYFCKTCGSRVFHHRRDPSGAPMPTANIKGGLVDGLDVTGAWHIWTSEAVVPIPEGDRSWPQSPPD